MANKSDIPELSKVLLEDIAYVLTEHFKNKRKELTLFNIPHPRNNGIIPLSEDGRGAIIEICNYHIDKNKSLALRFRRGDIFQSFGVSFIKYAQNSDISDNVVIDKIFKDAISSLEQEIRIDVRGLPVFISNGKSEKKPFNVGPVFFIPPDEISVFNDSSRLDADDFVNEVARLRKADFIAFVTNFSFHPRMAPRAAIYLCESALSYIWMTAGASQSSEIYRETGWVRAGSELRLHSDDTNRLQLGGVWEWRGGARLDWRDKVKHIRDIYLVFSSALDAYANNRVDCIATRRVISVLEYINLARISRDSASAATHAASAIESMFNFKYKNSEIKEKVRHNILNCGKIYFDNVDTLLSDFDRLYKVRSDYVHGRVGPFRERNFRIDSVWELISVSFFSGLMAFGELHHRGGLTSERALEREFQKFVGGS